MKQLESALIIALEETIPWGAALPPVGMPYSGRLTQIDPGQAFDVTQYARRDREFQHRDMINAAAVAKVSIHAQTVWSGTAIAPTLQGVYAVTNATGTNVDLPFDAQEIGAVPVSSTSVIYVGNVSIPYDSIRVTDPGLYARDLLIYETLARAAAIFPVTPPIVPNDPTQTVIGSTSIWATAQGTWSPSLPNAAMGMSPSLFTDADQNLANTDNQVAGYAARLVQVLKNPFAFATRIYVEVTGAGARETETYVLTNNAFIYGQTYGTGDEVFFSGVWYRANYTTGDLPPSAAWTAISEPNLKQFLADPSLSSRNRIVYNISAQTLQWFRETLDTVHVPQIAGFYIPGILPAQTIETVALVPENKDSQFWRQKAGRVCLGNGSWSTVYDIYPTAGPLTSNDQGGKDTAFQGAKAITLMAPGETAISFTGITCPPGSYVMDALVHPASTVTILGIDLDGGVEDPAIGSTTFSGLNTTLQYQITLPAGAWNLYIGFANDLAATSQSQGFGLKATFNGLTILSDTLPLAYTDSTGAALPTGTPITSSAIAITSTGQHYVLDLTWTTGSGLLRIDNLTFVSTANQTSHYIMVADWVGQGTSTLDVIGQRDVPDVMPFSFYVASPSVNPTINLTWQQANATQYSSTQTYYPGDQVYLASTASYYQAAVIIPAGSPPPDQNANWALISTEPQIPLLIEHIHLQQWTTTTPTPLITGFAGFRQDMLERANRADQDAYRAAIFSAGTGFPEFRVGGTAWDYTSTGSWMNFQEPYNPRLREIDGVTSGNISQNRDYLVGGGISDTVVYNSVTYTPGQSFTGVAGVTSFTASAMATVTQLGAYRVSRPGDIGQPALVPAGLEFRMSAGTIAGWYASYASYPTVQALQPWMIEAGMYVAQPEFWSPQTM